MKRGLARMLVRLYPRAWRERYGTEFEALLEEMAGWKAVLDVMGSALGERVWPTLGGETTTSRFESWSARAPWAVFGLAPLALLAVAYSVALFLLWSGWRMFLPEERAPFVAIDGWAIAYFGVGRVLYFFAPMLIGCIIAWLASRHGVKALWPAVGLVLVAVIGSAAQVRTSRPTLGEPGRVGMELAFQHPLYAAEVLALSVLVYMLLRMRRRMRAA